MTATWGVSASAKESFLRGLCLSGQSRSPNVSSRGPPPLTPFQSLADSEPCIVAPHNIQSAADDRRGSGPASRTEAVQGPASSLALRPHAVPVLTARHLAFISLASMLSVLNTFKFAYFSNLFSPFSGDASVYLGVFIFAPHTASQCVLIKIFQIKTSAGFSSRAHHVFPYNTFLILITDFQAVCTLYSIKNSIPPKVVTIQRLQLSAGRFVRDIFTYSLC